MDEVRGRSTGWIAVLIVTALVGSAGCAARTERLPECTGKATPINVLQPAGDNQHGR